MKIIDLTLQIKEGMQTFSAPWHPFVEISQLGRHGIENRETRKIILGTHTGTHIDAPRHFIPGGNTVDMIRLDSLVGKATVVDFSWMQESQFVTVMDLEKAIADFPKERLIIRFDWDRYVGMNKYYSDHPYFSKEACEWLVDKGCILIAIDTPQPDNPLNGRNSPNDAENHKILLNSGTVIAEYLTNIKSISYKEVELVVAPLNILQGDGAPARILAIER